MRLIDADELWGKRLGKIELPSNYVMVAAKIYEAIKEQPTADAMPIIHADWIYREDYDGYECTNCFHVTNETVGLTEETEAGIVFADSLPLYCPKCGAKMDG